MIQHMNSHLLKLKHIPNKHLIISKKNTLINILTLKLMSYPLVICYTLACQYDRKQFLFNSCFIC